ncbi:hypothetical protein ACJMK2_029505 [Sinanodonta woodiana]|uniref:Uncharacterized protein n=1 Tax=Sinanodonta woodiana TaxID=1069815 RepID=A0ABD3XC95_SINWO
MRAMSKMNDTRRNAERRLQGTGHLRSGSDNERLESFRGWTGQIDPTSLVNAGFSYTGKEDAVRCFSCNVVIQNWKKDMDPLVTHVARAPHCRHLLRLIPADLLAEMKDQIFDHQKMRVPCNGNIKWPCNQFTGERVEEQMCDSVHAQPNHPSAGRISHNPNHGEVHRNVGLPVDNASVMGELDAGMDIGNGDVDINDALNSVAAQSVLQTGYGTEDQVKTAIVDLRRNGKQMFNGRDILETILAAESHVRQN